MYIHKHERSAAGYDENGEKKRIQIKIEKREENCRLGADGGAAVAAATATAAIAIAMLNLYIIW